MDFNFVIQNFLSPAILFGIGIGAFIFFLGLGLKLCLKLFNS